jgi:hypothetical protein
MNLASTGLIESWKMVIVRYVSLSEWIEGVLLVSCQPTGITIVLGGKNISEVMVKRVERRHSRAFLENTFKHMKLAKSKPCVFF